MCFGVGIFLFRALEPLIFLVFGFSFPVLFHFFTSLPHIIPLACEVNFKVNPEVHREVKI